MQWKNNQLTAGKIKSANGGVCRLKAKNRVTVLRDGKPIKLTSGKGDELVFATEKGGTYTLLGR